MKPKPPNVGGHRGDRLPRSEDGRRERNKMIYLLLATLAALMGSASLMIVTRAGESDGVCKYDKEV